MQARYTHLRRAAVAIVIGFLTTVIVAWGCAVWINVETIDRRYADAVVRVDNPRFVGLVSLNVARRPGAAYYHSGVTGSEYRTPYFDSWSAKSEVDWTGPSNNFASLHAEVDPSVRARVLPWLTGAAPWPKSDEGISQQFSARGWPFLCIGHEYRLDGLKCTARGGISLTPLFTTKRYVYIDYPVVLPLLPLSRGLVLNTVIFASCWWIALSLTVVIRRHLRRARNLCPQCAYDLHATPAGVPCPECGRSSVATS